MSYQSGWRKFSLEGEEIWEDGPGPNPWYQTSTELNSVDLYTQSNRYKLELGRGTYNMSSDYIQSSSQAEPTVLKRRVSRLLKEADVGKEVTLERDEMIIIPGRPAKILNSYLVRLNRVRRQTEFHIAEIDPVDVGKSLIVEVDYLLLGAPEIRVSYV